MLELFANPAYLMAGGALISSPIIIHLINRMRFKRLRWAAMEFLLKAQKRSRRRLIIEQLILLLLRCLLVALAALLVLRFLGLGLGNLFAAQQENLHVIVLDDTLSMNDHWKDADGIKTSFQVARKDVLLDNILKNVSQSTTNDRVAIVQLSRVATDLHYKPRIYERQKDLPALVDGLKTFLDQSPEIQAKMTPEQMKNLLNFEDEILRDITSLQPGKLHVELVKGVEKAQEIAANHGDKRVTVHVISDFRKRDWVGMEARPLHDALLKLAKAGTKVHLEDTAHPFRVKDHREVPVYHDNVGIVDMRPNTRVTGKGMPVKFTVTVANFTTRETDVQVVVHDDATGDERLDVTFNERMPLKVPPGETATCSFDLSFFPELKENESFFASLSARLESADRTPLQNDGLLEDNVRHVAVEIRNKVPVLVVDGRGAEGRKEGGDTYFIEHALSSIVGSSYQVVHADKLTGGDAREALEVADLSQYPTVLLLDVPALTPKQLASLEKYVRQGGGVGFFLGPLVDPVHYNEQLYANGLFPVPLEEKYFPARGQKELPAEYTGRPQLLLRDDQFPSTAEKLPVFGAIFKEPKLRDFMKHLPVRRYWPALPVSEWQRRFEAEAGKIAAALPADREEYKEYRANLNRYQEALTQAVQPGAGTSTVKLADILNGLLTDRGDGLELASLQPFWKLPDPDVQALEKQIRLLRERLLSGQVREVANLPNEKSAVPEYVGEATNIMASLPLDKEEYKAYHANLKVYFDLLKVAVGPTSKMQTYQLADILKKMLADRGDDKELGNLQEFWRLSDPKIATLAKEVEDLRRRLLYSHPMVVVGGLGQGRIVAVMTTAGKEWNDWAGGITGSVLYAPIIWEMQNYLSSQSGEGGLSVGDTVTLTADRKRYHNKALKVSRYFYKAQQGKPSVRIPVETDQFADAAAAVDKDGAREKQQPADTGVDTFTFRKTLEPGLYLTELRYADDNNPKGPALFWWGHVYNVDTKKEGRLQRASQEELDSGFLREAGDMIEAPEGPNAEAGTKLINKQSDLSESPWFFLLFIGILVAEQALAVHLSFHLKGSEAELPSQVVQPHAKAAA